MTTAGNSGAWQARAVTGAERQALLAVRATVFRPGGGPDRDAQDDACQHFAVQGPGGLIAGFRARVFASGAGLPDSYAAGFYDLSPLCTDPRPVVEIGRVFVQAEGLALTTLALRLAWGAMVRIVADSGAGRLIGCTSFPGADPDRHAPALASLAAHVGPPDLIPRRLRGDTVSLTGAGTAALPGLLRTYLALGAWVGDHAVIDHDLDTLHVFTCLDVAAVPAARAASLQAATGG